MKHFFVIGNPVAHSLSPQIHELFARQCGVELSYERRLFPAGHFRSELSRLAATENPSGANITVPFKVDAADCCDILSPEAALAGAVNTMSFSGGVITGNNTDGIGLVRDIAGRCSTRLRGSRVLILGAGGAVRGIIGPMKDAGCAAISVANRTFEKAKTLAGDFGVEPLSYPETSGRKFDIIINGTSASITGGSPAVDRNVFEEAALAYDLFYCRVSTPFMKLATAGGCGFVTDGLGMLVEQAAESFHIWNAVLPDTRPVYESLRH